MNGYDKDGNEIKTMSDLFDVWDKKEFTYDKVQNSLHQLKDADKLKEILNDCTVCPVHNGTCNCFFEIVYTGYNPDLGHKQHKIMICPFGVKDWANCYLSK